MKLSLRRSDRWAVAIAGALIVIVAALVAASLRRHRPPMYAPTPPAPAEVGERWVGPALYTVDAQSGERWRFFSFARGSVVERPGPLGWDLAFRRFHIIANGGAGFAGRGGIRDLGPIHFDSVHAAPENGYRATSAGSDSINAAIADWYDYGFTTHLLTPRPRVYAIRTADGRYAKLELLGYYCEGERPGCVTFRYVYQGDGSASLIEPAE